MTKENDRAGAALSEKTILDIAQPWFGEETKHLRLHLVEFALAVARAAYPSSRASSSRAEVEKDAARLAFLADKSAQLIACACEVGPSVMWAVCGEGIQALGWFADQRKAIDAAMLAAGAPKGEQP